MLGNRVIIGKKHKDEGEKPFWISFADLMTALMVLFLLVMSVALLAVTKTASETEQRKATREEDIGQLLTQLEDVAKQYPGMTINRERNVIDFGNRARFETGSSQLTREQAKYLRGFLPKLLALSQAQPGSKWLKRIVVEGFADQRGDYLMNLNLSLQRSQRVLCVLLANVATENIPLSEADKEKVRDLFLVGGYSFNSAKKSLEESRRIELRLEYYELDEPRVKNEDVPRGNFGICRI
ncbi:MAG: OmpA family protein [Burkholderiaceae bacterium]|jgi:outer membrane protein OmpA-like peptidoglycan-associated protein|nr:OmpA family protein [Burkholderiaceae bacterium]